METGAGQRDNEAVVDPQPPLLSCQRSWRNLTGNEESSEGEKPEAAVTESEAGGGAKPGLPLPMGQLAQPFPAYLAQLALGVTLPPLDPGSLNSIALKSLWAGMQLLAAHRRSCGQPSSHQTSRRDTAGRTKKIGHDGETKSDGHRVRRTHHPQVADRRVDIGFENVQL